MSGLERVVALDDDPDVAEMLDLALAQVGGLDARIVRTGEAFLASVAAHRPQLVLVDRFLDGDDGLAVLERMRHEHLVPAPVVVVMTANVDAETRSGAAAAGAAAVIAKPFSPLELASELRAVYQRAGRG